MAPVLFEIFGIPVFAYTTFLAVGIFGGIYILHKILQKYKLSTEIIFNRLIFIFIFSWAFGRVFHIIFQFSYYQDTFLQIFNIFDGKAFVWGILLGLYLIFRFILSHKRENIRIWYDVITPAWMFVMTFYYAGSFLSLKTFGAITQKPWGIVFEGPNFPFSGIATHPIDAYIGSVTLILFIVSLIIVLKKQIYKFPGILFWGSLFVYSLIIILVQPLLMSPKYISYGVNVELFTSWIFFSISLVHISLLIYYKHGKKSFKK